MVSKNITIVQLEKMLENATVKTPILVKETLDKLAETAQKDIKKQYKQAFTLRKNGNSQDYTSRTTQVKQAKALTNVGSMKSITFTTAEYMGSHETGETVNRNLWAKSGKTGVVPFAFNAARGGGHGRAILQRYRFNNIGVIGKRAAGMGFRNGMNGVAGGAFFMNSKKSPNTIIIAQRSARKKIQFIRYIKPSVRIKAKNFFERGTAAALRSEHVRTHVQATVRNRLLF